MKTSRILLASTVLAASVALNASRAFASDTLASEAAAAVAAAADGGTLTPNAPLQLGEGIPVGTNGELGELKVHPITESSSHSQVVGGITVYPGSFSKASTAVQNMDESTQLLTVIHGPGAPTSYSYEFDLPADSQLVETEDGSVEIQQGDLVLGEIDKPWAQDSLGRKISTGYSIDGHRLTQYILLKTNINYEYPITIDPKVSFGIRIYVRYQKSEVRDFKQRGYFVGAGVLAGAACGKIPLGWLVTACGVSIAVVSASVLGTFQRAADQNKCVELKFNYQGIIMEWTTKSTGTWCK